MAATAPAKRLEELRKKLVEQETTLKVSAEENKSTKGDFTALDKLVKDFLKIPEDYEKILPKLQTDFSEKENYAENKGPMIKEAVKEKLPDIKRIFQECQDEVKECRTARDEKRLVKDKAKNAYDEASRILAGQTQLFDEAKLYQKQIEDNLKKLAGLKEDIEKEENGSKFAVMYYLMYGMTEFKDIEFHAIKEFIDIKNATKIVPKEELEQNLNKTWKDMDEALKEFRQREVEKNSADLNYDAKEKELKQLEDNLRAKILSRLAEEVKF